MIVCPNCSGNLKFDIESQKMHCAYCDVFLEPSAVKEKERDAQLNKSALRDNEGDELMEVAVYSCPQCGAELMSSSSDATAFCSFCGAANILTERIAKAKRPTNIIPFKITKDECKKRYSRKLAKALFAPNALKNPEHIESFRGIYMPYWSYNVYQKGRAHIEGTQEEREGDYRIVRHYDLSANLDNKYEGISHDASKNFADNISESLAPFNTSDIVPFSASYLSGFYADIADVDSAEYVKEAKRIASNDAFDKMKGRAEFNGYSVSQPDEDKVISDMLTKVDDVERSMFPVWFLSYRSKDDRVAYAAINGQTGKVTADIPIDKAKYLAFSAAFAVVLWLLLNLFNTTSLLGIMRYGVLGATAALLIDCGIILKKLSGEKRDRGIDMFYVIAIFGMIISIVGFWVKVPLVIMAVPIVAGGTAIAVISKQPKGENRGKLSIGILTALSVLGTIIWNKDPANDVWYYIPQILITLCTVWSFFDVLFHYNKLMTRPLPQFSKTGGDDNA